MAAGTEPTSVLCLGKIWREGFPQVLMFGVGGLLIYAAYLSLDVERGTRLGSIARNGRIIVLAGLLAVLLELTRNSTGLEVELSRMRDVYLAPPILLLRSFFPHLFGNPVEGTDWAALTKEAAQTYNPEFALYCGLGVLLAALGGILFAGVEKRIRAFLILAALSIGAATSPHLMTLGYALLPPIRASRISRVSVVGCFALCALGSIGFSMISARLDKGVRKRFLVVVGVSVAIVLLVGAGLMLSGDAFLAGFRARAEALPKVPGSVPMRWSDRAR